MKPFTVAHVLFDAYPDMSGYAIRSKYIVDQQRAFGYKPTVIVSPFNNQLAKLDRIGTTQVIGGIQYHHLGLPASVAQKLLSFSPRFYRQVEGLLFGRELITHFEQTSSRTDIIHAHSPYLVGQSAVSAAKQLQVPMIYEKRGSWEDTQVALAQVYQHSLRYRYHQYRERLLMKQADHVVVISNGLRQSLIEEGIAAEKILVVPNGVDVNLFSPQPRNEYLKTKLGLQNTFVIGYITSIRRLEGIHYLIQAMQNLADQAPHLHLLIVGDGDEKVNLERQAKEAGLLSKVHFTGKIPHSEITNYYSIIDLFVVPRINARVCHLVTPLKPLEAMAMGVPVLVSDVRALRELVTPDQTGLVFRAEDVDDLSYQILVAIRQPMFMNSLAENALSWVRTTRNWASLIIEYDRIYKSLLNVSELGTSN